jgi:cytochrome d ubiquinol oxidase subunit I
LLIMLWAAVLWWRGRLFQNRLFLWSLVAVQPLGWLAVEMGWVTAEVGRQPWLIYNLVRTSQGISPIPAGNVIWSLSLFVVIFVSVGASYFYYVLKTLRAGPDLTSPIPPIQRPAGMRALETLSERREKE